MINKFKAQRVKQRINHQDQIFQHEFPLKNAHFKKPNYKEKESLFKIDVIILANNYNHSRKLFRQIVLVCAQKSKLH